MANTLYDSARERFLTGVLNWDTDDVQAVLLSAAYTYTASHEFQSDLGGTPIIAGPISLTGKTSTDGAADANNATFTSVSGTQIKAIGLFVNTGNPNTSPLLAYIDVATGLPITPNGGDIIVTWDDGPNKIFRL